MSNQPTRRVPIRPASVGGTEQLSQFDEHAHEVSCPQCGATIRARMADDPAALNRAAADQAHRDDLARDVARLWVELNSDEDPDGKARVRLYAALDRLAAAYGTGEST